MGIKLSVAACNVVCKIDQAKLQHSIKVLNAAHKMYKEKGNYYAKV